MAISSKYFCFLALWLALAAPVARAETSEAEQIQAALESWVVGRAPAEKITGVAAYISFGDPGPAIEAFAGKTGPDSQDPPERQNTLFQMGSTSKSFTAGILKASQKCWRPWRRREQMMRLPAKSMISAPRQD